ncbi:hypothetical protein GP486_000142 [Trichoglossum hirsutum]|uniref:Uncharacterized protein n=1 Tax=Trichoglossum hirsutum TaxID=265104 RepID=A0A9P8LJH6_9PEZI|nr:hypothetical protein GP486_000142 [Trichoglossum hirsutum]
MPPISSGLQKSFLKSALYERSRDLLSRIFGVARGAGNAPTVARSLPELNQLLRRQNNGQGVVIPSTYSNARDGPSPGSVVGIVIGSVLGFLFLLWLIWICVQSGNVNGGFVGGEFVRERRSSYPRRVRQVIEIERPPRRPERVIVGGRRRSSLVDSSSDSEVTVEETVRRSRSSRDRPRNGVRYINPDLPAGGDGHIEKVYDRRGSGSRRSWR